MRPPGEKAALGRRRPASHTKDSGNIDAKATEMSDQRVSGGVIAHRSDGQDAGPERGEVVGSVGAAARNNVRFPMLEDEHWGFARNTRDFAILKFVRDEIAKEDNRFCVELFDALAKREKVDRS